MKSNLVYGLKHAMEKGESLQQAMQGFVNAGYPMEDVQGAGRVVQGQEVVEKKPIVNSNVKPVLNPGQPIQKVSSYVDKNKPQVVNVKPKIVGVNPKPIIKKPEKVSGYNQTNFKPQNSKQASKGLVIGLGIVLLILIAGLVSVLIFKESILSWFG